jgi:hypothetical protein
LAALLTFVRDAWGNAAGGVQLNDVAKMRTALHREAELTP